jgi:hypothetical protein
LHPFPTPCFLEGRWQTCPLASAVRLAAASRQASPQQLKHMHGSKLQNNHPGPIRHLCLGSSAAPRTGSVAHWVVAAVCKCPSCQLPPNAHQDPPPLMDPSSTAHNKHTLQILDSSSGNTHSATQIVQSPHTTAAPNRRRWTLCCQPPIKPGSNC